MIIGLVTLATLVVVLAVLNAAKDVKIAELRTEVDSLEALLQLTQDVADWEELTAPVGPFGL